MLDIAVLDFSEVNDTSAFTRAQVSAHPVVVELVIVGAGAEGRAAAACQSRREQLIAKRGVIRNVVVVQVGEHIQTVRQMLIVRESRAVAAGARGRIGGTSLNNWGREFALAVADTTRKRSSVVVDTVVGDLQVMRPTMDEDTASTLGAVGDRQPINT